MYHILVCDDEKDIVTALGIYLKSDGYQVYEAYNGKEALDIIRKEEIHLVLMDIMMPEIDGIEAMVKIQEFSNETKRGDGLDPRDLDCAGDPSDVKKRGHRQGTRSYGRSG